MMRNMTYLMKCIIPGAIILISVSCRKEAYLRDNIYDSKAEVHRNYTLKFDHIEVVSESSTTNVNGLLDVKEVAVLNVYLKNDGPDPCLLENGEVGVKSSIASSGFYLFNNNLTDEYGITLGSSDSIGYKVSYIEPGKMDYISFKVRTYETLNPNQDIDCFFDLVDYDNTEHHIDFKIHVE